MGHSQSEKLESHGRILRIAAARFRQYGLQALSVADLMKEAGLTHGGFYRHFASRDALVVEALALALEDGQTKIGVEPRPREPTLAAIVSAYLAEAHRDAPAEGCAVAALAVDAARSGSAAHAALALQLERNIETVARLLELREGSKARAQAIFIWCSLVGALTLARAVGRSGLSTEILRSVRAELAERFGAGREKPRGARRKARVVQQRGELFGPFRPALDALPIKKHKK